MSVWIRNLIGNLGNRPVIILHGNVRDRYIDQKGQIYSNLTELLRKTARELGFSKVTFYDMASGESSKDNQSSTRDSRPTVDDELESTEGRQQQGQASERKVMEPPTRTLARWVQELRMKDCNRFLVVFYLDKLISYKQAGYTDDERQILLQMEKLIENIESNDRLVLVALQDTMVPIELYTSSPKVSVLSIPLPDRADRLAYLTHRLGDKSKYLELVADLTDGLFLHDLDRIAKAIGGSDIGERDLRRIVNKYRIGEQEDYWGQLNIEKLNGAIRWFSEQEGVRGQDEALRKVIDVLCMARAGLTGIASGSSSKPKGVLFFAGPTGVGKTFVAKKLAKFLFGTEEAFLRFDMSEFKEEHTVSKFIGSPPGYVGYEQGGMLTNAVRAKPFSVILFDEIEKAHPRIMDIFLQILDDGRLTDSRGQTVFFTETIIIFTSNIGARTTDSRGATISERAELESIINDNSLSYEERKKKVREHFSRAVEQFFMFEISRPELLNRIGNNIVPFNYIHAPEVQKEIVGSHLKRIKEEFEDRYRSSGHRLEFGANMVDWLVQRYGDQMKTFGGRGITNAIENEIISPLAKALLRAEHRSQSNVNFKVTVDGDVIKIT